jgi:hypothetical protein
MKVRTFTETSGRLFWIQKQYLDTNGPWQVLPVGEPVLGYLMDNKDFLVGPFQKAWPQIPAYETGVGSVLQEWGYELEYRGDCAAEFGNGYLVRKLNPTTCEMKHSLLVVGALRGRQKEAVGLTKKLFFRDKYILDTEEDYTGEIVIDSEIDEVFIKIKEAEQEWKRRKQTYFAAEFFRLSRDFGLTAVIEVGGESDFELEDIPEHFIEIHRQYLPTVFDNRRNITPAYKLVLINKAQIELNKKKFVNISVPEEYKGFIIGKAGANIKALSEKLKCKINLK